jgi:hypothetical protein
MTTPEIGTEDQGEIEPAYRPDRHTLRVIKWLLDDDSAISQTTFEPSKHHPRLIRAQFDEEIHASTLRSVEMEIRWFTSGNYTIHFFKKGDHVEWCCRWERYHVDGTLQDCFCPPPDAQTCELMSGFPRHPIQVILTIIAAIKRYF